MCRNGFLVVDSWRGVAEEAIQVFVVGGGCGQEEPGIIISLARHTPQSKRKEGSGDSVYGELCCDKILLHPIRFSYSLT